MAPHRAIKMPKIRVCRVCGKRFINPPYAVKQAFCSAACRDIHAMNRPHACFFCGKEVTGRPACPGECTRKFKKRRKDALAAINYIETPKCPSREAFEQAVVEHIKTNPHAVLVRIGTTPLEEGIPEWFLNLPVEETTSSSNDDC